MSDEPARLHVKNWREFQHYKKRRPPWIKLQRSLLDDFEFACLPDASAALAPRIWLLASESDDGSIPADPDWVAFRVHKTREWVISALKPLIEQGFIVDASGVLAACYQNNLPEGEAEGETETEREGAKTHATDAPTDYEPIAATTLGDLLGGRFGSREPEPEAPPEKPPKRTNGTRIPDDFELTDERRQYARSLGLSDTQAEHEFAKFVDYWRAASGQRATKRDWDATWRNWCRTAAERLPRGVNGQASGSARRETLQPDTQGRLPWNPDGSPNPDYRGGTYWQ